MAAVVFIQQRNEGLFGLLSDEVLDTCFAFLGSGQYLYVATTCKRFNDVYYKEGIRKKETSYDSTTWSVSCAELCLKTVNGRSNKQEAFETIARMAGKEGRMKVIKWIYRHNKYYCNPLCFLKPAVRSGQIVLLEWAKTSGVFHDIVFSGRSGEVAKVAGENCQIRVLNFLFDEIPYLNLRLRSREILLGACRCGQVPVLEWLNEHGMLLGEFDYNRCCSEAGRRGHIPMMDWFIENGFDVNATVVLDDAFYLMNPEVFIWSWRNGANLDEYDYENIALYRDYALLQALFEAECPWGDDAIQYARSHGHDDVVDWAVENGWA